MLQFLRMQGLPPGSSLFVLKNFSFKTDCSFQTLKVADRRTYNIGNNKVIFPVY